MSKFICKLSYKNACILKHALRDKINDKEDWIKANTDGVETHSEELEELEEEKRALEAITREIDRNKEIYPYDFRRKK